jgi:glycosyltransferase involved in cell wall biosynthesis
MRITFVLPYAGLQGGIRVIAIIADSLKRLGHQVMVISHPQVFTVRHKVKSLLLDRRLPKSEPSHFDGLDVEHRVLERARPVVDADVPDADVVIATYYTTAEGVLNLSPAKGAKAIFIQMYEVDEGKSNPKLDASWRMPFHKITCSKWLADFARDKFGDSMASVVPNGVDVKQFHAPPRGRQAQPTVGLFYSTTSMKGLATTTLPALKQVATSLPALRIVSFGAEEPSSRCPLPPNAEFHYRPRQDKLRDLYAKCDVWICGSNAEGFHLPPHEAMACRCPVVSTRVGGPMDMIEDGVNGYLANVKDADTLADRTLRVLKLPEAQWRKMSDAAYYTATRFTWEGATGLFENALKLAIERNQRGELSASLRG